ncbi:MAG: TRAP transporter small permease [Bacillota bacterium]
MKKIVEWVVVIQECCTAAALISMSLLVFVQVFGRKVIFISIPWSEEMARFLMIWLVYLGLSVSSFRGGHISINVVERLGKYSLTPMRQLLTIIIGIAVSVTMFCLLADFMLKLRIMGQVSAVLRWPMWVALLPVLAGILLLSVSYILQGADFITGRLREKQGCGATEAGRIEKGMEDSAR